MTFFKEYISFILNTFVILSMKWLITNITTTFINLFLYMCKEWEAFAMSLPRTTSRELTVFVADTGQSR